MPEANSTELEELMKKTLGDPKTRKRQLALVKEVDPNRPIPELDAAKEVSEEVSAIREELKTLRQERENEKLISGIQSQRQGIKTKYNLNDEDISKVESLMIEKKIGDHDVAAQVFTANNKVATPTPSDSGFRTVKMPSDEKLLKDPSGWAREEAHSVIDELRGVRR